jgi:hypothetical protein
MPPSLSNGSLVISTQQPASCGPFQVLLSQFHLQKESVRFANDFTSAVGFGTTLRVHRDFAVLTDKIVVLPGLETLSSCLSIGETRKCYLLDVLKGTRWLLVKNWENLNDKCNEKQRLLEAVHINQPLATAYYLKEELGLLWKQQDKASADSFLKDWIG